MSVEQQNEQNELSLEQEPIILELQKGEVAIIINDNAEVVLHIPHMNKIRNLKDNEIVPYNIALAMALTLRTITDEKWVNKLMEWMVNYSDDLVNNLVEQSISSEQEIAKEEKEEKKEEKYEVWLTQGQGGTLVDKYLTLEEALHRAQIGIESKEGSFGIHYPNGQWHNWE